jgi:5-methylcytosine-specific restriction protein A
MDVLQNFRVSKTTLKGKAIKNGSLDQNSILVTLPNFFRSILDKLNRLDEFVVEGSIGAGNMAGVPWVGIFNRNITESAQNGYYIVLLFSADMNSCFLSLNQGVTAFENLYSRKTALHKLQAIGEQALRFFKPDSTAVLGPIDLKTTGHLGKGYQQGAIESYYYDVASLPTPDVLESDFLTLLQHYDTLFSLVGLTLESLTSETEAQYQQAALEKAAPGTSKKKNKYIEPAGILPVPQPVTNKVSSGYRRNPNVAAEALNKANFKCEIARSHITFTSNAKNVLYVEAHHLIPISKQASFNASLDVTANVVALCPMCHRLLHHGKTSAKKDYLNMLLAERTERLKEKGISINKKTLLSYYSGDISEEDA